MIELKSPEQIDKIRQASGIVVSLINSLKKEAAAGISTAELDRIAKNEILSKNARPAFLGYRGYPGCICTSINEEIVHGIPGKRILKEGDLLSIDVGVELGGYFSDAAVTVIIGRPKGSVKELVEVTRDALYKAINEAVPGNRISDMSHAIQQYVESHKFSVIRDFVGHGIGQNLHEDPQIPNFGQKGLGIKIREGMVFAIEPMVSAGGWQIEILSDKWTAVTKDRSLAAHFEHTIAVTKDGAEILTDGIM